MIAFCTSIRFPELLFLPKVNFPVTRIQVSFPAKVVFSCGKFEVAESSIDGSSSLSAVPPTLLTAEKEEAKAILNLCLKKQGFSNSAASRAINKSDVFVDHLVSKLHSVHKSRYLVGRELTTLEIRDALSPYLETLLEEHGNAFVDVVENFPNRPVERRSASPISSPTFASESKVVSDLAVDSKKLRALARVSETVPAEKLPQHVVYLIELGLDLEKIQGITQRFPAFAYYSLEGKVRPVVEFLLDLGVPKTNIPIILVKRPQLCGISLSENLIPTMKYLESLGLDNKKWAKVLYRFPALLTYSRQKLKSTLDFLYEMGLSDESIGKVLTCCPNI
ncbi:hypothetical protein Nepgr_026573 [Nepenthes gracilis]|uniref:Uncharacterized protein n=1 Tax=Nepenthes gracilis TaxID=150966 RepID=A0AAD3T826_NEPGR|nr:hypothetical protein Nepgr_026573 [Nepenthes gracilis]